MNAYFTIVLTGTLLFFIVWALGWLLERFSRNLLKTTREYGSRSWYLLVGPGVALHESSHALGCLITRTPIVEFKPINVDYTDDGVILGYVKYKKPSSVVKNAVINLAPVAVSLVLLVFFALGATYLVPTSIGIGGQGLHLLNELINVKNDPVLLNESLYPISSIILFVYQVLYNFAGLTVISPIFWIVAFLAMTIMFSNAPSDVDINNAMPGLKAITLFNIIWLGIAYFFPQAGWLLFGVFELLAVMWALSLAFAAVGYGFFILVVGMSRLKSPFQILPFLACIVAGFLMWYFAFGTHAFQTVVAIAIFSATTILLLLAKPLRSRPPK